jgi:hypothetical protein
MMLGIVCRSQHALCQVHRRSPEPPVVQPCEHGLEATGVTAKPGKTGTLEIRRMAVREYDSCVLIHEPQLEGRERPHTGILLPVTEKRWGITHCGPFAFLAGAEKSPRSSVPDGSEPALSADMASVESGSSGTGAWSGEGVRDSFPPRAGQCKQDPDRGRPTGQRVAFMIDAALRVTMGPSRPHIMRTRSPARSVD